MSILDKFQIGDAVWYKCEPGEENEPVVLAKIPIKVRWTDELMHKTIMVKGEEKQVKSKCYVGRVLHSNFTQEDINVGDYFWEGTLGTEPADPQNGAMLILSRKKIKNLNQTVTYYKFEG